MGNVSMMIQELRDTFVIVKRDMLAMIVKWVGDSNEHKKIKIYIEILLKYKHKHNIIQYITQNIAIKYCIIIEDTCYPNPCQHEGYCEIDQENGYKCMCTHGFHGDNCQFGNGV